MGRTDIEDDRQILLSTNIPELMQLQAARYWSSYSPSPDPRGLVARRESGAGLRRLKTDSWRRRQHRRRWCIAQSIVGRHVWTVNVVVGTWRADIEWHQLLPLRSCPRWGTLSHAKTLPKPLWEDITKAFSNHTDTIAATKTTRRHS